MSLPPIMTIWECKACHTRYGQKRGEDLSTCPRCKSEQRAPLAQPIQTVKPPSPDDYMDFWRFARQNETIFLGLLERTGTTTVAQCPLCECPTFLHNADCWLRKMQIAEEEAQRKELAPGRILLYSCDRCRGSLATRGHGTPARPGMDTR